MNQDVEGEGSKRRRLFRPLEDGFWPDVKGALAVLAGVAVGALLFHDLGGLVGGAIGATASVIVRALRRRARRGRDPGGA